MKNFKLMAVILGAAALCAACTSMTTPRSDAAFGTSLTVLKAQQSLDPAASVRNEGRMVEGMEGQAASNAVDQYYKSFTKQPAPMTILNMGLVGGVE